MKSNRVVFLVLALVPALMFAQHKGKKRPDVPAVFATAHYIYVEAEDDSALDPAARQAVVDMQVGVQEWYRYKVTMHRDQADLIFRVRKGRMADGRAPGVVTMGSPRQGGAQLPSQSPQAGQAQEGMGGEMPVGSEDDQLRVFAVNADGKVTGPVWTRQLRNGLDGPKPMLLKLLIDSVELAYPPAPPAQPSNP